MAVLFAVCCALAAYLIYCLLIHQRYSKQYGHIPAVGSDNILSSFVASVQYLFKPDVVLERGYRQYKGHIFRVPQLTGWLVFVSGEKLVEELRKAPENVFSTAEAQDEFAQVKYTMNPSIRANPFHVGIIRSVVNKKLEKLLPMMNDEISAAFDEELESKLSGESEWTPLKVTDILLQMVSRTTARAFVGPSVCRNGDYHQAMIQFTKNLFSRAMFINTFPDILKPVVGSLVARMTGTRDRVFKHLTPIIQERKAHQVEKGLDYPGKHHDFVQWLVDAAPPGFYSSTENLALRTLGMNLTAIHTTSLALTNAVYDLAAYPQYAEPLRQEINDDLGPDTTLWTKETVEKCWKLDGFLKESLRMHSSSTLTLLRKVLQDYTFSDGTVVPAGSFISALSLDVHYDPEHISHPETFDGFRYSYPREKLRDSKQGNVCTDEDVSESGSQLCSTAAGPNFTAFGAGRHVCPGRFFAVTQLKCMLAHLLLNYDVKMREEGIRPPDLRFAAYSTADWNTEVMFKHRV